jgi:uncharacterized repeat protein (TIGR04076 family)
MKTIRAVTFCLVFAGLVWGANDDLLAFFPDPTFDQCPADCSCTVNHNDWSQVSIECEEASPAEVCDEAWDSSYTYCYTDLPNWIEYAEWSEHSQLVDASCWIVDFEGCTPMGLDPPANISLDCDCLIWY